jgi:hypothetical protein
MEKIVELEEKVENHEGRIVVLERNDAVMDVKLGNICKTLDALTKTLSTLAVALFLALIGFVFWFIQNIGGRT